MLVLELHLHDDPLQGTLESCPEYRWSLAPHALQTLHHQSPLAINNLLLTLKGPASISAEAKPSSSSGQQVKNASSVSFSHVKFPRRISMLVLLSCGG